MIWDDSKSQAFFLLKMVIFADNGFYLKKWDDWKRSGVWCLSLFCSIGRNFGFLLKTWKTKKISHRNIHKCGSSADLLCICFYYTWLMDDPRWLEKELLVKEEGNPGLDFSEFFFIFTKGLNPLDLEQALFCQRKQSLDCCWAWKHFFPFFSCGWV